MPYIGTKVRGGKLHITQDKWIEPSQSVIIRVGAPFTTSLETSGYSDVVIAGIDGPRIKVNAGVGSVTLNGRAERLQIRTKTGDIDATNLETLNAELNRLITLMETGEAYLDPDLSLSGVARSLGTSRETVSAIINTKQGKN